VNVSLGFIIRRHACFAEAGQLGLRILLNALEPGASKRRSSWQPDDVISFGAAFGLWFYAAMIAAGILKESQVLAIVQMFAAEITTVGNRIGQQLECNEHPDIALFALADRRFLKWPQWNKYYDIQECKQRDNIPWTFEGVSYNLALLATNEWHQFQRELANGAHRQDQEDNSESRNAGNNSVDTSS